MKEQSRDAELEAFVSGRYRQLRRTAYLLCGSWDRADDLVQAALAKLVVAARRRRIDNFDAYARTVLTRVFLDERKRQHPALLPEQFDDPAAPSSDRSLAVAVLAALRRLPPRQRAAVVLRYWEDRSTEEAAEALGVSVGTIKSQCAKGLAALRPVLADLRPDVTYCKGGPSHAGR